MPTLAEILASKGKKKTAQKTEATAKNSKSADTSALGQPSTPESRLRGAGTGAGIKITPETEKAQLAASIKQTLDATAPPMREKPVRELGATEPGERIPMRHPDPDAPEEGRQWFASLHSFETALGIVIEPGPKTEYAWIAVKSAKNQDPILLHRVPILYLPNPNDPF
jgi:hypothetical protein